MTSEITPNPQEITEGTRVLVLMTVHRKGRDGHGLDWVTTLPGPLSSQVVGVERDRVFPLDGLRDVLRELVEYPKAVNGTLMNLGGKGNQSIHSLVARTNALLALLGEG